VEIFGKSLLEIVFILMHMLCHMNTINEKAQRERIPENTVAEHEKLSDQPIGSDQSVADIPCGGESLAPDPERVAELYSETSIGVSMADCVDLELQQLREQLLRVQADFDNYRRRAIRDQDDLRRFASMDLIGELLPIVDSFELGLKSTQENSDTLSGFQMIFTQLQTFLASRGVKEVAPRDELFNPQWAEAVAYVNHEDVPQEYVVQTVRKGYLLHDRLLRPASVVVSKGTQMEENNG
jgi:molecular chaperone GrpE